MAFAPHTTPKPRPHPNMAAFEAALRDLARFNRLQQQTAAIEAGQMAGGL